MLMPLVLSSSSSILKPFRQLIPEFVQRTGRVLLACLVAAYGYLTRQQAYVARSVTQGNR
jgi:hypothetical protein